MRHREDRAPHADEPPGPRAAPTCVLQPPPCPPALPRLQTRPSCGPPSRRARSASRPRSSPRRRRRREARGRSPHDSAATSTSANKDNSLRRTSLYTAPRAALPLTASGPPHTHNTELAHSLPHLHAHSRAAARARTHADDARAYALHARTRTHSSPSGRFTRVAARPPSFPPTHARRRLQARPAHDGGSKQIRWGRVANTRGRAGTGLSARALGGGTRPGRSARGAGATRRAAPHVRE